MHFVATGELSVTKARQAISFNLSVYAGVLAFAIRLSYTSIFYMAVALFILTLVDEFSKVIKDGTFQRGAWKNA